MLSFKSCGSFHFMKAGRWSVQIVRSRDAAPLKNATVIDVRGYVGNALLITGAALFMICGIVSAAHAAGLI